MPLVEQARCQDLLRETRLGGVSSSLPSLFSADHSLTIPPLSHHPALTSSHPQRFRLHSSFICAGGQGSVDTCEVIPHFLKPPRFITF